MPWDNNSEDKKGKNKNPWGSSGNNQSQPIRGPWGSGGGSGGGGNSEPPDLDEMMRKAKDNLQTMLPGNFGGGKIVGLGLLLLLAIWLATGIFLVQPGEQAVVQRFGKWERTIAAEGVSYRLPYPFETVTIVNVEELRRIAIGFVDGTGRFRNSEQGSIRDVPDESLMLTSDRNIVDIDLVVLWNVRSAEDFLFNVVEQEATIKKVAESAIREVIGQNQMFPIITRARSQVAESTKEIIQKNLDDYDSGVHISQILIEKAEVHPEVQGAFQDVQSAKQDAEDIMNKAQAYREDILPRARGNAFQMLQQANGYKQSTISKATGGADRFTSVLRAYQSGQDVTRRRIYIETMEEVLKNSNKIIVDQKNGGSGVVPFLPLNEMMKQQKQKMKNQNQ